MSSDQSYQDSSDVKIKHLVDGVKVERRGCPAWADEEGNVKGTPEDETVKSGEYVVTDNDVEAYKLKLQHLYNIKELELRHKEDLKSIILPYMMKKLEYARESAIRADKTGSYAITIIVVFSFLGLALYMGMALLD